MKLRQTLAAIAVAALGTPAVLAQTSPDSHDSHHPATATSAAEDFSLGEVRKIDKSSGKVTLRHGEIKSLDMPPMTMVFRARDAALLDKIKVGDKVRFKAEDSGGTLFVTAIEIAP